MFVDATWPQKHWLVMGIIARFVLSSANVKTGYLAARINVGFQKHLQEAVITQ
jgi:hypothetical protein